MKRDDENISLGTDPEFFLYHPSFSTFMDASKVYPGKEAPIEVVSKIKGKSSSVAKLHSDGFLGEFSVSPSTVVEDVVNNVMAAILAAKNSAIPGTVIIASTPTVELSEDDLKDLTEESRVLGCEMDFCAYGEEGSTPKDGSKIPFRSAGGHIHIETGDLSKDDHDKLAKFLDLTMAIPFSVLTPSPEKEKKRRTLYGN